MARALILLALLAMSCGSVGSGASPSPSTNPLHFDVTATEKDHAITMHVGQKLQVVLNAGGQLAYQQVRSSDTAVLEPTVDPYALAPRGVTVAAFKAMAAGESTVTAVGAPVCPSGQACPMFAALYKLEVTVLS